MVEADPAHPGAGAAVGAAHAASGVGGRRRGGGGVPRDRVGAEPAVLRAGPARPRVHLGLQLRQAVHPLVSPLARARRRHRDAGGVPRGHGAMARAILAAKVLHGVALVALVLFGMGAGLGVAYYVGVAVGAALIAWEHRLVKPGDLSRLNAAFFTANGIVSIVVFLGALVDRVL